MNFRILICALLLLAQSAGAQKLPALTIGEGEVKSLPAGTHSFSKIDIHSGGMLIIESRSSDWCILDSKGDVNIHGTIQYANFKSGKEPHSATAPDGTHLTYTFHEDNLGGNGGNGGNSRSSTKYIGAGGQGASANAGFGSGGGSGGGYNPNDSIPKRAVKGNDAAGSMGGKIKPPTKAGGGGNGAARDSFGNGGLLYIYCGGNFNGSSGSIYATGKDAANGAEGQSMSRNGNDDGPGGGGGSGGAPGSEGGVIRIKIVGTGTYFPRLMVNGGRGGRGGAGGTGSFGDSSNGMRGEDGKDGNNGHVDILH